VPTANLSVLQIAATIVPRRVARWPESSAGSVWAAAHRCVDGWHSLVRQADLACSKAEDDPELNVSGVSRRRAEICDRTMITLANFKLFEIAEKALSENIDALERLSERDPEQIQMLQKLKQTREDLREGVESTRRMLFERCKIREGASV
jgi:hypothetical protein